MFSALSIGLNFVRHNNSNNGRYHGEGRGLILGSSGSGGLGGRYHHRGLEEGEDSVDYNSGSGSYDHVSKDDYDSRSEDEIH